MAVKREHIGEAKNGEAVYSYTLTNRRGMSVVVLNLGATLRDIIVPADTQFAVHGFVAADKDRYARRSEIGFAHIDRDRRDRSVFDV